MCEDPKQCPSHQEYSSTCACIRENFSSPEQFAEWRKLQIKELGEKIKDLIPEH